MLADIVDLDKLRRGLLYALIMVLTLLVQEIVLSRITLFGVHAMIIPLFPVAVGILQGGWWGMLFGLVTGMLADVAVYENTVMFTLLMPLLGFLATAAERFLISRRLIAVFAAGVCALFFTALVQGLRVMLMYNGELLQVLRVAALQTLWSVPFIFALYYPCRALSERALD